MCNGTITWEVLPFVGFAVVCGSIAKKKGRDFFVWAALGFVFNIAALVFVVFVLKKRGVSAPRNEFPRSGDGEVFPEFGNTSITGWLCHKCGYRNMGGETVCYNCGAERGAPPAEWECEYCGSLNPETDRNCGGCGARKPAPRR